MNLISRFLNRLLFATRHQTLKKIVLSSDSSNVLVFHKGNTVRVNRYCPHQGAPLEKAYLEGNYLVCHWHGCKFSLNEPGKPTGYCLTRERKDVLG